MMRIDEKIASMDRMRRQNEREERNEKDKQEEPPKRILTIEEALEGILKGELQLEGEPLIEFETYTPPKGAVPFVIFKNFYEAKQETEEGIIYLKRTKEISQILSWPKAEIKSAAFEQWGNLLVNGMAANRIYAEIKEKKQLTHIEYISYEVPSKKGPVYNLIFRFKEKKYNFVGNYNCMSADKDTFGVILEAMAVALDQWMDGRIREAQDEKNRERGNEE